VSKSIFISHATVDKELVRSLVDFLEQGMGVPEAEIFCSSLPGYGIPTGVNFVSHMKDQIQKPKAVILLLTPSYFKSNFCLCEMGASWALSHKIFPIIVPPLTYADVKDVLLSTQAMKVEDDLKYNELRDYLLEEISLNKISNIKWDTKRQVFLKELPSLLSKLSVPKEISVTEHEALKEQFKEAKADLIEYEEEVGDLKKLVKRLETAKDKEQVQAIKQEFAGNHIVNEVDGILSCIKSMRSSVGGKEVFKFVLCDYYVRPYKIDWFADRDAFDNAVRSKIIAVDDGEKANWDTKQMKRLHQYLDKLDSLLKSDEDGVLQENFSSDEGAPDFEPDSQEFWTYHYGI
jgi:hypothetical protein